MTEWNGHLDEGTIHAWLDGALSPDESARVEGHAGACAECATLVAEARGLIAASSRILSSLDAVPAGVIPGRDRSTDQLAVLRARKRAATRRWWNDPRFVAAASLVFIAGTFSVVWRVNRPEVDSTAPSAVAEAPNATAPVQAAGADSRREAAAPAAPPSVAPAPTTTRVAAKRFNDSTSQQKVPATAADAGLARGAAAANESARRDVEAKVATAQSTPALRDQAGRVVDSVARESAAPPVAAFERLRSDSSSLARASANRTRSLSAPQAAIGGLRMSAAAPLPIGCYELREMNSRGDGPVSRADTVRLLAESPPVLSDPTWYFARRVAGALRGDLLWRPVDSITVELQIQAPGDTSLVRFHPRTRVVSEGGGQVVMTIVPDLAGLRGVRAVWATKVDCR